jgi:hypothetical protein
VTENVEHEDDSRPDCFAVRQWSRTWTPDTREQDSAVVADEMIMSIADAIREVGGSHRVRIRVSVERLDE